MNTTLVPFEQAVVELCAAYQNVLCDPDRREDPDSVIFAHIRDTTPLPLVAVLAHDAMVWAARSGGAYPAVARVWQAAADDSQPEALTAAIHDWLSDWPARADAMFIHGGRYPDVAARRAETARATFPWAQVPR
jgi:hypothetical protein